MDQALLHLAGEMDDPSADLVIAALILNVRRRGDRLAEVLTGLARAARDELDLRRRVSAGRAELRRGVQIVVAVTVTFALFLAVFGGDYIAPYDSPAGQVALLVVIGIFVAGFAWMRRLSGADAPAPFLERPGQATADPDAGTAGRRPHRAGPDRRGGAPMIAMVRAGRRHRRRCCSGLLVPGPPAAAQPAGPAGPVRREPGRDAAGHRLRRPARSGPSTRPDGGGLGRWAAGVLARRGIAYTSLRQDLALTGRSFEATMARKVILFARRVPARPWSRWPRCRSPPASTCPPAARCWSRCSSGAGFFLLPDLDARAQATRRRRDFRRALGAYLDLVALEMAGSAAPAEALPRAARVGSGWPLAVLRDTLYRATRSGRDQWAALTDLGNRIGVAGTHRPRAR